MRPGKTVNSVKRKLERRKAAVRQMKSRRVMAMEVLAVGPVGVYKHTGGQKMLNYAVSRVLCRPNVLNYGPLC